MAGDWIRVGVGIARRREVLAIAAATGRTRHEVTGLMVDFWGWVTEESRDGHVSSVTFEGLSRSIGGDIAFWEAVEKTGWIETRQDGIVIPGWEKWFSVSAKKRLDWIQRKRRQRLKEEARQIVSREESRGSHAEVTRKSRDTVTCHVVDDGREERVERREERDEEKKEGGCSEPSLSPRSEPTSASEISYTSCQPDRTAEDSTPLKVDSPGDPAGLPTPKPGPPALAAQSTVSTSSPTALPTGQAQAPALPRHAEPLEVPEELMGLELYRVDVRLCRRWPELLPAWQKAFPGVDLLGEVARAHAWEISNPTRRKRNRARYLAAWLARAQDGGRQGLTREGPTDWAEVTKQGALRILRERDAERERELEAKRKERLEWETQHGLV